VRRAIEELKQVNNYDDVYNVLASAFSENDFDGFELRLHLPTGQFPELRSVETVLKRDGSACLQWRKPGSHRPGISNRWSVSLDLESNDGDDRASLVIYRHYKERPLQLDVNLLTAEFPDALAEAIGRARARTKRIFASAVASEEEATERAVAEAS